jgi:hypothetical protein
MEENSVVIYDTRYGIFMKYNNCKITSDLMPDYFKKQDKLVQFTITRKQQADSIYRGKN